jgi:hypothetical protein
MPTNEPLVPCSYCAPEEPKVELRSSSGGYQATCAWCGARGPMLYPASKAAAAWNTRHIDPATLALARLGAVALQAHHGVEELALRLWDEAVATPGILDRVAELLQDTEARERREDEG